MGTINKNISIPLGEIKKDSAITSTTPRLENVYLLIACIAGGQAVKNRGGERPPVPFGSVFQVPLTSLYFVISQLMNSKYIFNMLTENYYTLDNTVINSVCNLI